MKWVLFYISAADSWENLSDKAIHLKDKWTERACRIPDCIPDLCDQRVCTAHFTIPGNGTDNSDCLLRTDNFTPDLCISVDHHTAVRKDSTDPVKNHRTIGTPEEQNLSAMQFPFNSNKPDSIQFVLQERQHTGTCYNQRNRNAVLNKADQFRVNF